MSFVDGAMKKSVNIVTMNVKTEMAQCRILVPLSYTIVFRYTKFCLNMSETNILPMLLKVVLTVLGAFKGLVLFFCITWVDKPKQRLYQMIGIGSNFF